MKGLWKDWRFSMIGMKIYSNEEYILSSRFVSHMSNDVGFAKVTLTERCRFHTIVQVYKILHQLVPVYLQDMFTFSEKVTGYVGRNSNRSFIPRMRTTYRKKSCFIEGR